MFQENNFPPLLQLHFKCNFSFGTKEETIPYQLYLLKDSKLFLQRTAPYPTGRGYKYMKGVFSKPVSISTSYILTREIKSPSIKGPSVLGNTSQYV